MFWGATPVRAKLNTGLKDGAKLLRIVKFKILKKLQLRKQPLKKNSTKNKPLHQKQRQEQRMNKICKIKETLLMHNSLRLIETQQPQNLRYKMQKIKQMQSCKSNFLKL